MSDIKNSYEAVVLISMKLGEDGITSMIKKFSDLIQSNATLDNTDEWGKRRLAYLINKESEAYYVLFKFTSKPEFPAEFERICRITDGIMRHLVIKD